MFACIHRGITGCYYMFACIHMASLGVICWLAFIMASLGVICLLAFIMASLRAGYRNLETGLLALCKQAFVNDHRQTIIQQYVISLSKPCLSKGY